MGGFNIRSNTYKQLVYALHRYYVKLFMYLHVCLYICVCLSVCMYVCMYVWDGCIHVCLCMYGCMCLYLYSIIVTHMSSRCVHSQSLIRCITHMVEPYPYRYVIQSKVLRGMRTGRHTRVQRRTRAYLRHVEPAVSRNLHWGVVLEGFCLSLFSSSSPSLF